MSSSSSSSRRQRQRQQQQQPTSQPSLSSIVEKTHLAQPIIPPPLITSTTDDDTGVITKQQQQHQTYDDLDGCDNKTNGIDDDNTKESVVLNVPSKSINNTNDDDDDADDRFAGTQIHLTKNHKNHNNNDDNEGNDHDNETNDDDTNNQHTTNTTIITKTKSTYSTSSSSSSWELTWPIWHMLPHSERKIIAKDHGFSSIGEFEESMTLSRALAATNDGTTTADSTNNGGSSTNGIGDPYDHSRMADLEYRPERYGLPTVAERGRIRRQDRDRLTEDGGGDSSSDDDDDDDAIPSTRQRQQQQQITSTTNPQTDDDNDNDDTPTNGGLLLTLPTHLILHSILPYLPIDTYATLSLTSPTFHPFTRTEPIYQQLCYRNYINPSRNSKTTRKGLRNVRDGKLGGLWRELLGSRPRVKMGGGGLYILKYTIVKKIQRDMWTEIPIGAILESTYYRYLHFHEDGSLRYALTSKPPHEMIPHFVRISKTNNNNNDSNSTSNATTTSATTTTTMNKSKQNSSTKKKKPSSQNKDNKIDKLIVYGTYKIHRHTVTVNVEHPWHHVRLTLNLLPDGCEGARGTFWAMEFMAHHSSRSGNFDEYFSRDLVTYDIPSGEPFRFLRDWRL